jgi:cytochrome c-type biogenesis protein CcmI
MTVAIALLLTVLTFAFVAYPLFKQRSRSVGSTQDEKVQELHSKRDTTYSMLKELEFDFQSGILTDEDYHDLETRYKRKAISILRDTDALEKDTGVEDELEKQILQLRRSKGLFCPQCGARHQEGDRFCSRCGTSLSQGGHVD